MTQAPQSLQGTLDQETRQWIAGLPEHVRPRHTAARFPRILVELCARWPTPLACRAYFTDLLIDHRGNRQGFPFAVASELASLKYYYDSVVFPVEQTLWADIISRSRD